MVGTADVGRIRMRVIGRGEGAIQAAVRAEPSITGAGAGATAAPDNIKNSSISISISSNVQSIGVIAEAEGVSAVVKEGKGGGGSFFLFSGLNGNIGKSGREDFNFDDLRIVRC
ncbi:hypothetical protein TYRP_001760 [Tyrophagus putrescentiae]|nr:hypothetical protein TYRP_001760 [Tyrophagus putrescentiae]